MASAVSFLHELDRFGPESRTGPPPTVEEARAYCARLAASHYENFSVITHLTPRGLRTPFANIYAFCRWSDDLGDEVGDPERSKDLLRWWRAELESLLYLGKPSRHPVMIALAETIEQFSIPIDPFAALISAFEQDQEVSEYETFDQLLDYCRRSANPVGHLVLYLGRVYNPENARLSDLTCTGLQLANFWQDVRRDLAIGRIYLPREDRRRFQYTDADLQTLQFNPAFRSLLAFQVERAKGFLIEGRSLVAKLPRRLATSVDLFNRGGLAILGRLEKADYNVLDARPSLSKFDKGALIVRVAIGELGRRLGIGPG